MHAEKKICFQVCISLSVRKIFTSDLFWILSDLQEQFTFISAAISLLFHVLCTTDWAIYRIFGRAVLFSVERIRVLCQQQSYNNCFRNPYDILPWRSLSWSIERFFINKYELSHCGLLRLVRLPSAVKLPLCAKLPGNGDIPCFFLSHFFLYVPEYQTISFYEPIQQNTKPCYTPAVANEKQINKQK